MVLVRFGHLVGLLLAILPSVAAYPFVLSSSDLENPFPALSDSPDLVLQSQRSRAVKFSRVVVFGDSLSDGGCVLEPAENSWRVEADAGGLDTGRAPGGTPMRLGLPIRTSVPRRSPFAPHRTLLLTSAKQYFGHRFSNGRVYAEDVASALGLPITNFGAPRENPLRVPGFAHAPKQLLEEPPRIIAWSLDILGPARLLSPSLRSWTRSRPSRTSRGRARRANWIEGLFLSYMAVPTTSSSTLKSQLRKLSMTSRAPSPRSRRSVRPAGTSSLGSPC